MTIPDEFKERRRLLHGKK